MYRYQIKNKLIVAVFLVAFSFLSNAVFLFSSVFAQDKVLDISAHVFNKDNQLIADGEYDIRFAIYTKNRTERDLYPSNSDGGSRIWEEEQRVKVSDGAFNTSLGKSKSIPESLNFADRSYYLGIRVGNDSELVPRKKIGYVPLAINSDFLDGREIGNKKGNILVLNENGVVDIGNLPIGTDENSLVTLNSKGEIDQDLIPTGEGDNDFVQGDDERLHDQNTDTGTKSTDFTIGSNDDITSIFNIFASNNSQKPTIRYNGSVGVWQYSNDGSTFSEFDSASSGNFLPATGGTMTGNIAFNSTQTFGSTTATELGYLSGLTFSAGSILYGSDSDSLTALTGALGDDTQYLRFNWNGGVPTLSWEAVSGGGSFTSFTTAGDSGTSQSVTDGNTLTIAGGTNISTVASATDTITINLDSTLTGVTWNGNAIDISSYTNLSGDAEIVLTGDTLSIASTIARDSELHSAVTMSGAYDYITLSGQDIVRGQVNLTTDVSGILPVANGGSGINGSIASNGQLLIGNGTGYSLANLASSGSSIVIANGAGTINLESSVGTSIDISSETNLSGDTEIVLTGDALSISSTIARDSELHSAVTMSGAYDYITLSGQDIVRGQVDLSTDATGILPVANGGTGITTASLTGIPTISSGTWSVSSSLGVTAGGTGTTTQFTQGSLVFAGASGVYSQDNTSLFWDDANNELGIGTATPLAKLDVAGDMIISGTNAYLNFGSTSGTLGYGIRDNAGEMEYRNTSGVWTGFDATSIGLAEDSFINAGNLLADSNFLSQSIVLGDYIYLFGGTAISGTKSNIYRAPISNPLSWTDTGSVLPAARAGAQIKVIGDYVYMFGGNNSAGSPVNTIYRATTADPLTWVDTGSTLPGVLSISHVEIIGSNVYLFGGYNGAYTNVIYSATTADPLTWSNTGSTLPGALAGSSLKVIGDYVYLFGGRTGASSYTNAIYRAALTTPTTWANTGSILPSALHLSSIEVIGDYVYLFGGRTGSSTYTNKIYRAQITDPTTWSDTGSVLPSTLNGAQSEVINASVYLFGGSNGTTLLSTIFVGTLSTCQSCIADADADTKIHTEASADEDKIRFYTAGVERMAIDQNGNLGLGTATFGTSAAGVFAIANGTIPSTSIADGVQIYAEDVAASSELKVRDEAGNITTLSPHNFSLLGGPSEDLAWSFYSERDGKTINVDMTKSIRLIEELTGEKLIYLQNKETGEMYDDDVEYDGLFVVEQIDELKERVEYIEDEQMLIADKLQKQLQQIEDLKNQNQVMLDFMLAVNAGEFVKKDENGNVEISGNLKAEIVEGKGFVITVDDKNAPTIGRARMCAITPKDENNDDLDDCSGNVIPKDADNNGLNDKTGEPMAVDENSDWIDDSTKEGIVNDGRTVFIETTSANEGDEIFVTPRGKMSGSLFVSDIENEKGFRVETKEAVENETEFSWWIVSTSE